MKKLNLTQIFADISESDKVSDIRLQRIVLGGR